MQGRVGYESHKQTVQAVATLSASYLVPVRGPNGFPCKSTSGLFGHSPMVVPVPPKKGVTEFFIELCSKFPFLYQFT